MADPDFISDCSNCAALCCLALAFDKGAKFSHDKAAGEACKHLSAHRCSIHADLTRRGYEGCVQYECLGAGQRVTALFGQSWQEVPKLTAPMMAAFATMRDIQELRQMLIAAQALPLADAQARERETWAQALGGTWTKEMLEQFAAHNTGPQIRAWFRSLAAGLAPS